MMPLSAAWIPLSQSFIHAVVESIEWMPGPSGSHSVIRSMSRPVSQWCLSGRGGGGCLWDCVSWRIVAVNTWVHCQRLIKIEDSSLAIRCPVVRCVSDALEEKSWEKSWVREKKTHVWFVCAKWEVKVCAWPVFPWVTRERRIRHGQAVTQQSPPCPWGPDTTQLVMMVIF